MTAVLHHVALTVTDIDASVAWYSDLFGFKELVREDHAGGNGGYGVVLGPEVPGYAVGPASTTSGLGPISSVPQPGTGTLVVAVEPAIT